MVWALMPESDSNSLIEKLIALYQTNKDLKSSAARSVVLRGNGKLKMENGEIGLWFKHGLLKKLEAMIYEVRFGIYDFFLIVVSVVLKINLNS
jgi:hypothetical protein